MRFRFASPRRIRDALAHAGTRARALGRSALGALGAARRSGVGGQPRALAGGSARLGSRARRRGSALVRSARRADRAPARGHRRDGTSRGQRREPAHHGELSVQGRRDRDRGADEAARQVADQRVAQFTEAITRAGFVQGSAAGVAHPGPARRIVLQVREIFDQTPGPGAGRRLGAP